MRLFKSLISFKKFKVEFEQTRGLEEEIQNNTKQKSFPIFFDAL